MGSTDCVLLLGQWKTGKYLEFGKFLAYIFPCDLKRSLLFFFSCQKKMKTKKPKQPPPQVQRHANESFTIFTVIFLHWKTNYINRLLKRTPLRTGQGEVFLWYNLK